MNKSTPDANLQFIREKVYKLRSAIMYSMSNDLLKIPNNIVTALRIDDEGYLWFVCKSPVQHINEYEQSFPARLHFYKKGVLYFMEVSGKATIIKSQYADKSPAEADSVLLIRMSISSVEYTEPQTKRKNKVDTVMEHVNHWLMRTVAFTRITKPVLSKLNKAA